MMLFDDLEALKRKVDQIRANKEQAQGAYNQLMKRIKEEFGCKTLQEAESLLIKMQDEELEAAKEYAKEKERFEKAHRKILSSLKT